MADNKDNGEPQDSLMPGPPRKLRKGTMVGVAPPDLSPPQSAAPPKPTAPPQPTASAEDDDPFGDAAFDAAFAPYSEPDGSPTAPPAAGSSATPGVDATPAAETKPPGSARGPAPSEPTLLGVGRPAFMPPPVDPPPAVEAESRAGRVPGALPAGLFGGASVRPPAPAVEPEPELESDLDLLTSHPTPVGIAADLDPVDVDPEEVADGWASLRPGRPTGPAASGAGPAALMDLERPDALELVGRPRAPSQTGIDLATEMRDCFALDDFTGALRAGELVLGSNPNDLEAKRIVDESKSKLAAMYLSRIGRDDSVPRVKVPDA
ncbi:MAG: hypothetical protein KC416_14195, partial [Myxococcales bacterium]|nr:hypothetical protein [Myxococcales bacterium]